jgi:AcrR family transcriptional regulator
MPKKSRTQIEVDMVKEEIVGHALQIIQERGLEGFTMRRLAEERLGLKAATLYSYYESKDHLYLAVLTRGFQLLYRDCEYAYNSVTESMARLQAMMRAYLRFGIEQANFYNLMFTWHVPKYQDYVGTPMEAAAQYELEESQKVYLFFIKAVRELIEEVAPATDDQIRAYIIYFWSTLHGYIAGINNKLLAYMHENPLLLRETVLENLFKYIKQELKQMAENSKEEV